MIKLNRYSSYELHEYGLEPINELNDFVAPRDFAKPCDDGDVCLSEDVKRLEAKCEELMDFVHMAHDNYYMGEGDEQSVAQRARKLINKYEKEQQP